MFTRRHHRGATSATHSTWWVIGNRSKARRVVEPRSRARRSSRGRAPGRPGRRRRSATARGASAAIARDHRALRAGARRVEDDEVGAADAAPQHPVHRPVDDAAHGRSAEVVGASAATPAGRPPRRPPTRPRARPPPRGTRANRPTPAYRSRTCSPARGASTASTASTSTRGASTCGCQKPSASTSKSRGAGGGGDGLDDGARALETGLRPSSGTRFRLEDRQGPSRRAACVDQAVVDLDHLVGAVLAQAATALRRAGRRTASASASAGSARPARRRPRARCRPGGASCSLTRPPP